MSTLTRLVMVGTCVVAAMTTTAAQGKRALTLEDYYRVPTLGGTEISPNGEWVVFTVSTRVESDNSTRAGTFVVPTTGGAEPRQVAHEGRPVTGAGWLGDGRLAYTSDRQRWSVDLTSATPAPVKVDTTPTGAIVSPDGRWHARLRDVARPPAAPSAATEFEKRHADRFKGAIFDWMLFQRDGQAFPAPNLSARPGQQITLQPAAGGDARVLVDQDLRPGGLVWHPDGKRLAFTADPGWRDEVTYESPDLWMVTADGALTRVTDDLYVHSDLEFSPDGQYLSYARTYGTGMIVSQKLNHGGPRDLYIRSVAGGEPINLTARWDLEPGAAQWAPDGKLVYFTAATGGESHLFKVTVPGGVVTQVTTGERRLGGLTIDKAFQKIAYSIGRHESPGDVFVSSIDGSREQRLTDFHGALTAEIGFSRADRLKWKSKDGTEIEGWLMYPHGYDASRGSYPLIVTSHGGPHANVGYSFDFKKQYFAANGYFVLDTNFRSSTGYGDKFKWATWGAWGDKDGEDVMWGLDYVIGRYPIDRARVGHTGHSYGGFMTNWLITQYPDRFAAAITGAGITNWISDYGTADIYRTKETEFFGTPWDTEARNRMIRQSPLTYAGQVKTPTLFVHGEVDQRVPYEEGEQMYFALKRRGVPAKMIQYAGQPHGIGGHWNNVHRMMNELAWWNRYLKRN